MANESKFDFDSIREPYESVCFAKKPGKKPITSKDSNKIDIAMKRLRINFFDIIMRRLSEP